MGIKDWPRLERPRERLINAGPTVLSDAELLATLLGSGACGRNAVDLARHLLSTVGSLHGLLELPIKEFIALPGLGACLPECRSAW